MEFSEAFVHWANTFPLRERIQTTEDLRDGLVFFQVLTDVDELYFGSSLVLEKPNTGNWVLRFHNLKRIYKVTVRYYSEVLGRDVPDNGPDLSKLAKSAANEDILRFGRLILAIAVQSDKRVQYVERIRTLDEETQAALMVAIEQILQTAERDSAAAIDAEGAKIEQEFAKVLAEIDQHGSAYQTLEEQHAGLQKDLADLKERYEDLRQSKKVEAKQVHDRELTQLHKAIGTLEDQLAAKQGDVEKLERQMVQMKSRVNQAEFERQHVGRLQEQLDEANTRIRHLERLEVTVDKYRHRLEQTGDLQKRIAELEEQNFQLLDRQEDGRSATAPSDARGSVDVNRQLAAITKERNGIQDEVDRLKQEMHRMQEEHSTATASIQEQNRHLEAQLSAVEDKSRNDASGSLDSELTTSKTELYKHFAYLADHRRLKISSLERQVQELKLMQEQSSDAQHGLARDDAKAFRQRMEEKLVEIGVAKGDRDEIMETIGNAPSNDARLQSLQEENERLRRSLYDVVSRLQIHQSTVKRAYEMPSSWLFKQRAEVDSFFAAA